MDEDRKRRERIARVLGRAVQLFEGDSARAQCWLETPSRALGNQRPLKAAETEIGAREVEDLIGRLDHGVFT